MRFSLPMFSVKCAGLLALLLFSNKAAAQYFLPAKAKLEQCLRVVGPDSVVFFYDDDYTLSPPGCATIRRHVRLDSTGRFHGFVRDYRLANNVLLLQGAYRAGHKEGVFEIYHDTGELAARGRYLQDRQVGDWAYWYTSGRPRQILSFRRGDDPLIQQFWEENGRQLVKDGNGTWYRHANGLHLAGAVRQGTPDGRWLLRRADDNIPVVQETFQNGYFRKGVDFTTFGFYKDQSRLDVGDWAPYSRAEEDVLGLACP